MQSPRTSPPRPAFTLIELLVVIAIVALLLALLVPAVQKVREAAARTQCDNNLKQLALACHSYDSVNKGLPPIGATANDLGWITELLPYVEQDALYRTYNLRAPFYDPSNQPVITREMPLLGCPSSLVQVGVFTATNDFTGTLVTYSAASTDYFALMGVSNACYSQFYPGTPASADLSGAFMLGGKRRIANILDGSSHTALLSEMACRPQIYMASGQPNPGQPTPTYGFGAWAHNNAHNASCYTFDGKTPGGACVMNCSNFRAVYSFHPGAANTAFADGSVRFLRQDMPGAVFYALVTQGQGEVVDEE
jgi:prepilin-type N-terminal cleavage/methylation domain-containing protein/prepilin-type processing-associated H-X9-DG protein